MGYAINLLCNFELVIILVHVNEKTCQMQIKYDVQTKEIHMRDTVEAI